MKKLIVILYISLQGCASDSTVSGLTRSTIGLGDVVSEMKREEIAFRIEMKNKILELEQRICELERSPMPDMDKRFKKYMLK